MGLARRSLPAQWRSEWLPYHVPSIGDEEIAEVVDTLRSGWLTTGAKTQRFERELSAFLGAGEALALSSGTAALHLALRVCGVLPGDDVIVPSYTFTATAEVVTYVGARPVLADVDPATGNVRASDVARVLTPRTRAVMPVHIGGLPCDMRPILALARDAGVRVVEDAAHAFEARTPDGACGTLGDAGAYSFYATKTITTGEGGALVLRDASRMSQARLLALHGISRDAWKRYTRAGSWRYEVLAAGHKYNLTDLAAGIGIQQLRKAHDFHARRTALARRYTESLRDLDAVALPAAPASGVHAWHLYVVRLRPGVLRLDRDAFIDALRERNIGTSVHFIPLHLQPYYQQVWGYRPGQLPGAEQAFAGAISLPLYPAMSDADVDDVVAAVRDVVRGGRR